MAEPPPFLIKHERPVVNVNGSASFFDVKENTMENAIDWFKSKIIQDDAIAEAPDGIYSWIWKEDGERDSFIAAPVTNQQEVGSLHINLWLWTGRGDVALAGELIKSGRNVEYNFHSGSFFQLFENRLSGVMRRRATVMVMDTAFESYGLNPTFRLCQPEGAYPCPPNERRSGLGIVSHADIRTSPKNMFFLRRLMKESELPDEGRDEYMERLSQEIEAAGGEVALGGRRSKRTITRRTARSKRKGARTRR